MEGLDLKLDPTGLAPDEARKVREALKAALDALEEPQAP